MALPKDLEKYDLSASDVRYLISQWVRNERNRDILEDKLINGFTYEQLAEYNGLSVRQVKNIVYKSLEKLIAHI